MTDNGLEKILRLTGGITRSYTRVQHGKMQQVSQYRTPHPAGMKIGTPFRVAWSNINVGNVLQFGAEYWRVISASQYPGHKTSAKTSGQTSKGTGAATGGSTTGVSKGASAGSGTGAATGGSTTGTGTSVYTQYLQNVENPSQYDTLTLPGSFVVTEVPILP